MILTFAEDFTSNIELDSELLGAPDSGMYYNRGVHPTLTVDNLLTFLPNLTITFADWVIGTTYNEFNTSRKRSDVVSYNSKTYQSLTDSNAGNQPGTSAANWLETNIDSLRVKSFIWTTEDNAVSALTLQRRLVENQYLYNVDDGDATDSSDDFFGWGFEPKGSDYVTIRINQIAFQSDTDVETDLFVINQGRLITTLKLHPNNGVLEFEQIGYTFKGKGPFYFATTAATKYGSGTYNDALKYDGFVCYPVTGTGDTAAEAEYTASNSGNGLNFNVSCYLDSTIYIDNNKVDLAKFYQTQFEHDYIRMMVHDSNNRFNIEERQQRANTALMAAESLDLNSATVARKYKMVLKETIEVINGTFDKFLRKRKGFKVKRKVV